MPQTTSEKANTTKSRLTPEFNKKLATLNKKQKEAVESIEGPVMVIAGPGTGKTQTLAMRVANILIKTQAKPSNILCLTFSTSGAKAMRERLRSIIGPDAYGITIETIHTFCNQIILEHPQIFEEFRALEQVSAIEQLRIIRRRMQKLGPGSVLGRPTLEQDRASAILNRISEMKREGVSIADLKKLIPIYEAEIRVTKTGKERDQNTPTFKKNQRTVKQFTEFIILYNAYNEELNESHRYDYNDMIIICEKALHEHDWLLAGIQERYHYVLVDEFQDLNGAQNGIIKTITEMPMEDELPNVFVVGDDDQAIYRFQGASMQNMAEFLTRFSTANIICLTENYRSTQQILDSAGSVIDKNEDRLVRTVEEISKELHAVNGTNTKPLFLRFPAIDNERAGIAEILKKANMEGIPWNKMSVLCRSNAELTELFDTLQVAEIPVILVTKQDLLLHPEVFQAITILNGILNMESNFALSAALGCTTFDCKPVELGRLWCNHRKKSREEHCSLQEYLLEVNEELPSSIRYTYNLLEELSTQKNSVTLPELMEKLLKKSHLLPEKDSTKADPRVIAGLHAFYDYVKDRVYENKALTLQELMNDLDQYMGERYLKLEYAVPHLVSDGVQLMTAHGAKGLEFDLVIIAHTRFRSWGDNNKGSMLALPDHLIFNRERDAEKRAKQEDERRLMYVAMTRARKNLILTFPETYRSGEELRDAQPSSFLAEAGNTIEEITIPPENVPAPIETLRKKQIEIDSAFEAFLRERLEKFTLSVTALNSFLKDPQEFLWLHLLQQPRAKEAHLSFGTVIHAALERRNLTWQAGKEFKSDSLILAFEKILNEREVFTKTNRDNYLHEGKIILKRYAEETANEQPIILSTERGLTARIDDIPLSGKVDRIDLFRKDGQNCRVIDYKTGGPKKTENAVRKFDNGSLFRQLVFYKILCDRSPSFTHTATSFVLDFVGNEKEDRRVIEMEVKNAEVRELEELIKKVWERIVALDFTPLQETS